MLTNRRNSPKLEMRGLTTYLFIALCSILVIQCAEAKEARVVCYYTNWSVYRPGTAKFNPQNINPYLCTHLIYAFGGFTKENTLKPFDKYQDIEKGGYAKFTGLKTYNPNLKTMIAIGGWNEGSSRFSGLVANASRRREFVKNTIKFMRQNKFDGLDLDWEYPSFRDGGKPKDRANYARLVQELREEFEKESSQTGRPRLLLTMAVPAGIEYIDKGYDVPKLNRYLDWMNILSYDYHSAFEPSVNHHSPLYPLEAASEYNYESDLNIDFTIKHYLEAGADADKLVLGIPTYGRSFTLFNPDSTDIGAPADGPGEQGDATREKGYLAYYEICESLMEKPRSKRDTSDEDDEYDEEDEEWTVVQPNPRSLGPYAYKGNQWVGYDDIDIVRKKAQYVAENSLGGIMFWSIDNDDFRGKCHGKPYPLIEAAKEALYKSLGLTETIATKKPQPTRKRTRPSKPTKSQISESSEEKDTSRNTIKASRKGNREESDQDSKSKTTGRRRQNLVRRGTSTESTLQSSTPAWGLNTPEPPTTPDPGSDFKCIEEGFFPHPRDCKKYFWCLESGPSNLGIVAHQFTCPSGLYFNKAADSCDFARNVLCNKKKAAVTSAPPASTTEAEISTTSTRTTTTATSTTTTRPSQLSSLFVTRRPVARITAATSSTTLLSRASSTVPSFNDDSDDEIVDEEDDLPVSEEDPKVIKELIDLIKKLGGVEQLEKHLAGTSSNSVQGSRTTTPATITRLLYEKVLSQSRPSNERAPIQQNSRGPQSIGISSSTEEKVNLRRDRPQYTTINRQRASTTTERDIIDDDDDDDSEEEEEKEEESRPVSTSSRPGLPQYVNIRRAKPSTTEEPETTARNALFERNPDNESEEEEDVRNRVQNIEYSTLRRNRPDTSEVTTSKYKTIQRIRSTTLAPPEENSEDEIKIENVRGSTTNNPTESPIPSSPTSTESVSSQVSTEPKTSSTQVPVTIQSSTASDQDNDVTDVNDINVSIASPSFASENGVIANAGSSSVLNAQITTLSNTPKPINENNNSLATSPITYSTKVTVSEEISFPTQRSTPLFSKRTRPTTTVKPQEITEQTPDNKVSYDRKYTNIKRTRINASDTSSPSLKARLRNEISTDSEDTPVSNSRDSDLGETSENVVKNRRGSLVRKIRSTTPASEENQDDSEPERIEADYGNKRFVRPPLRFTTRRLSSKVTSEEETSQNVDENPISSNGENGLLSRNRQSFSPRNNVRQPSYRLRGIARPDQSTRENIDNEESGNEFVQTEVYPTTNFPRSTPNRRFRPSFNSEDLSSLTALDNARSQSANAEVSTGFRNAQTNRRFRPLFTTTEIPIDDSSESDSSISPVINDRQRGFGRRGNRFTASRTTTEITEPELNTEASESSVFARGRRLNITRFAPRPFSASTPNTENNLKELYKGDNENENELKTDLNFDSKLFGKARLSAPVINVSEENKSQSAFRLPSAPSTSSSQQSINVTKVINSNILLGQTNNRSGILLLRRLPKPTPLTSSSPTTSTTPLPISSTTPLPISSTTPLPIEDEEDYKTTQEEEKLENIHLSETIIEEKEQDEESNTLIPERPRKRIKVVKKIRSTTLSLDSTVSTEPTVVEKRKEVDESNNTEDEPNTKQQKRRKLLIRRIVSSTTPEEPSTTEKSVSSPSTTTPDREEPLDVDKKDDSKNDEKSNAVPRVRKIIRRILKPVVSEDGKKRIIQKITEDEETEQNINSELNTVSESLTSTVPPVIEDLPKDVSSTTENVNLDTSEQSTLPPPSTRPKPERPSYRPIKRPINVITSTEPTTTTPKVYSRKYNNGPFTTPTSPSDAIASVDRPRVEGVRRPLFNRTAITTSRTTTIEDDEDIEEEEEGKLDDTPDTLVLVPQDQLFRRGPTTASPIEDDSEEEDNVDAEQDTLEEESDDEDKKEEEQEEEKEEEKSSVPSIRVTPNPRFANRFNSPQKPPVQGRVIPSANNKQPNRPAGFNRPGTNNKPAVNNTNTSRKLFNRPVSFQPSNRPIKFGGTSTLPPTESTTKAYTRKYNANRPFTEIPTTTEEINVDAVNAKHKELFSNPKRFSPATASSLNDATEEMNTELGVTDSFIETTTDVFGVTEIDSDMYSTTEESVTTYGTDEGKEVSTDVAKTVETTPDYSIDGQQKADKVLPNATSGINGTETTKENIANQTKSISESKSVEENTIYPASNLSTTSTTTESTQESKTVEPLTKTTSLFDKLFEVSRVVEVSSTQEKHRFNRKNESRLIEKSERKVEKKPTLDKIGEVSRLTFIKVVESDIPYYLTNLSHEYPIPNLPYNPIRIDEARNARALVDFSDSGKENLVASESVNSAYNHRNALIDVIDAPPLSEIQQKDLIKQSTLRNNVKTDETGVFIKNNSTDAPASIDARFVPGAVNFDDDDNQKADSITPRSKSGGESSTLAIEGLFNTDDPDLYSARQASINDKKVITGSHPFVVYAAPENITGNNGSNDSVVNKTESENIPSGRSITNFVKIEVLRPDEERDIKTFAKGREFLGVPAAIDVVSDKDKPSSKQAFTVSILNQEDKTNSTGKENSTSATAEPIVISIANLDRVVLQKTGIVLNKTTQESVGDTITTTTTTTEAPLLSLNSSTTFLENASTTESVNNSATEAPSTDPPATEAPGLESSIIKIKPSSITNNTLTKIAKKRPKLTFPRRSQSNQLKSSNITRLSIIPSVNQTAKIKPTNVSSDGKNIPYTTPKYSRNNSYTSGRSRFSANRSQNVPVDTRKDTTTKVKSNSTSEITRISTDTSKKVTIKPLRPGLLRGSTFSTRRTSSPLAQTSSETATTQSTPEVIADVPASENSISSKLSSDSSDQNRVPSKVKPAFFPRRSSSRFSTKSDQSGTSSTTPLPKDESHRFSSNSTRRRTVLERRRPTSSPGAAQNSSEGSATSSTRAPNSRPTRLFVRKYTGQRSGTNSTKTTAALPTTTKSPETSSRKNFRINLRRRPSLAISTTTPQTTVTTNASSQDSTSSGENDQESHSTIHQEKENVQVIPNKRKVIKVQKRPLSSIKPNQLAQPVANNDSILTVTEEAKEEKSTKEEKQAKEEKQTKEKIYSSVIKEDQTLVQQEKTFDTSKNEVKYDDSNVEDVTADVAVVAHHLLSAPLPTIPSYALDDQSETDFIDNRHFTRAYLLASSASPIVNQNDFVSTTQRSNHFKFTIPTKTRRISTTVTPYVTKASPTPVVSRRRPQHNRDEYQKIEHVVKHYRTFVDYEYYDDDDVRIVSKSPNQKVILQTSGSIQCLDQGNFPHPESCKKFISCARMENGEVHGWEYTCPKGLSFDPVGGICNWSAGLGCGD